MCVRRTPKKVVRNPTFRTVLHVFSFRCLTKSDTRIRFEFSGRSAPSANDKVARRSVSKRVETGNSKRVADRRRCTFVIKKRFACERRAHDNCNKPTACLALTRDTVNNLRTFSYPKFPFANTNVVFLPAIILSITSLNAFSFPTVLLFARVRPNVVSDLKNKKTKSLLFRNYFRPTPVPSVAARRLFQNLLALDVR